MIKAVIFDMDGVVVNTEPLGLAANREMYKSLNIEVPDEVYSTFIGNSDRNIVQKIKDLYPQIQLTHDELLEEKFRHFFHAFDNNADLDLMPGVRKLIIELHDRGGGAGTGLIIGKAKNRACVYKVWPASVFRPCC